MENFCKIQIQNWTEIEHRSLSMDMIDAYFNACNIFYLSSQYLISNNSFWTWKRFVEADRPDNQKIICCYFWKAQHFYVQVSFLSGDDSSANSNMPISREYAILRLMPKQSPSGSPRVCTYGFRDLVRDKQAVRLHLLKSAPSLNPYPVFFGTITERVFWKNPDSSLVTSQLGLGK